MSLYSIPPLFSSIVALSLGIFTFKKNPGSSVNRTFTLLNLEIFHWQICWFISFFLETPFQKDFIVRLGYSLILYLPFTHYHFTVRLLNLPKEIIMVWYAYGIASIWLIINWISNYFIAGYYQFTWGMYGKAGKFHPVYLIFVAIVFIRTVYLLKKATKDFARKPTERNQIRFVFLATLLYYSAAIEYLINYGFGLYPIGGFFILTAFGVIGYAIVRYHLMDINIMIGKGLVYLISLGMVCCGMWLLILIANLLLRNTFDVKEIMIFLVLTAVVYTVCILIYPRVLSKLEAGIKEFLYKDKYKYQDKLREIASNIPTIYDMERLLKYTVDATSKAVACSLCSIMLLDNITKSYSIGYNIGLPEELVKRITFYPDTEIIQKLRWGNRPIVKEELPEDDPVRERMDSIKAEVSVPIVRKDKLLGILNLNHKASGDIYSHEDLSILNDISKFLGMAIENISLSKREHQEELITYLNNIAYALAHELKNRSQTIVTTSAAIQSMLPQVTNVPQDLINLAGIANDKILEIDSLVNELVAYSNVQQREGYGPVDINKVLDESLSITDGEIKSRKINVVKMYAESNIKHGDRGQLIQVFVSVIRNSIEAMEDGGILTLSVSDTGEFWKIAIEDTGKGIPENHLGSIFEPFFTTKHDHKGLGLSIARRIIYDHAGEIKVESVEGKGTIIYIYLPKQMPEDKLKARAEIKRREDISYDRIKTKDYQDKQTKENPNGQT